MAVRSGFWNSVGTDVRTYYNHDFSHLISLMIKDGVHQNYGECLTVVQGTGMQAIVRTGEAWFNETWVRCDSDLQIAVDEAPIVAGFSRIDAIAIKIDATQSVRNGTIEYIAGTATAETPTPPELVDTDEIHWHLLATILVRTGDEEVLGSRITNYVGTDTTPFISGILDTISAEVLLNQWQSEWTEWSDEKKREFTLWFNNLHYILDGDVAGHLQNEIEDLYRSIGFTGTMAEVEAAIQAGTITVGMVVNITDDNDADDFTALQVSYDGTESGSEATSVQGAIDEDKAAIKRINTDLTRYNSETDYLQVKKNGAWVNLERAYAPVVMLTDNGTDYVDFDLSGYTFSSYTKAGSFIKETYGYKSSGTISAGRYITFGTNAKVDFQGCTKFVVEYDEGNHVGKKIVLNLDSSTSNYLAVFLYEYGDSSGLAFIRAWESSSKALAGNFGADEIVVYAGATIRRIYLAK